MSARATALALGLTALASAGAAHARGCHETSEIVGRHHCTHFGAGWAAGELPPIVADVTLGMHWVPLDGLNFTADPTAGRPGYTLSGSQIARGAGPIYTLQSRMAWQFHPHFYAGAETTFGYSGLPGGSTVFAGATALEPQQMYYASFAALVGASAAWGRFAGRVEMLAGGRNLAVVSTQFFREQGAVSEADALQALFEPRAQIEFWPTSGYSIGAFGGVELTPGSPVGYVAGFTLAGHLRVLDGMRDH